MPATPLRSSAAIRWSGRAGTPTRRAATTASRAKFPVAMENGQPIVRRIRDEIQVGHARARGGGARSPEPSGGVDRQGEGAAHGALARKRRARRGAGRAVGVRRRAVDPAAAAGHEVRADQDLRAVVRGDASRRCSASASQRRATSCPSCATSQPTRRHRQPAARRRRLGTSRDRVRRLAERALPAPPSSNSA